MSKEANATQLVKIYADHVIVRNGRKEYNDTAENFALDNGSAFPALPADAIGRSYIPGMWHRTTNGNSAIQLPMPWDEGEALLGAVDALVTAQTARQAIPDPTPSPPDITAQRLMALEGLLTRRALDTDVSQEERDYQDAKRTRP